MTDRRSWPKMLFCAGVLMAAMKLLAYGPFVPGESVSLDLPQLVGYSAKGLPTGLKLNKATGTISGIPKRPTGNSGVTVTFTKQGSATLTETFIVGPLPTISVTLVGDTQKCKVTGGNKAYLVGKKVSLAAVAPKGTMFVGWTCSGRPWPSASECNSAKIRYVMTAQNLELVANFKREQISIDLSQAEDLWLPSNSVVTEGRVEVPVETETGLKSLKARNLPKGLKLKQNKSTGTWSIIGTPRSTGSHTVVFTATAKSGAVEQAECEIHVYSPGGAVVCKPVIYLYPEKETVCSAKLTLDGGLTCTYPDYGSLGWRSFVASPDGTIAFPDGKQYYCLYWEGVMNTQWDFSRGYCVKGSETASFLADVLLRMGLSFREANEFIIYWLPLMQDNPYNVISFQNENYVQSAKLEIDPEPDSVLRIFMAWRASSRPVSIAAPTVNEFERKGFTVVEWGGTKVVAD